MAKVVAVGRFANRGGAASVGGGDADGGSNSCKNPRAEKEEEEERGDGIRPPIEWVPNEILCIILSQLDAKPLMIAVPQVCQFWWGMCQELSGVHLNFRWWAGNCPLEVVAGWQVLPALVVVKGAARCRWWGR